MDVTRVLCSGQRFDIPVSRFLWLYFTRIQSVFLCFTTHIVAFEACGTASAIVIPFCVFRFFLYVDEMVI